MTGQAQTSRQSNLSVVLLFPARPLTAALVGNSRGRVTVSDRTTEETTGTSGVPAARGQRAFFFALAYLCWFISPYVLFVSTTAVVIIMWRRQFASEIRKALLEAGEGPHEGPLEAPLLSPAEEART